MTRRHLHRFLVLALAVIGMTVATLAAGPARAASEIYTGYFSSTALGGYDAVAYFTEGKPVKGDSKFTFEWKGATWKFASADHLAKFKADPTAYAPQYGGYCSWAMARGDFASGDPNYWRIVDGKLYLNYDASVQKKWEKDIPGFVHSADGEWSQKKF